MFCVRPNIVNMFAGNCIPIIQYAKHGTKLIPVLNSLMTPFIPLCFDGISVQSVHGYLAKLYKFAIELASQASVTLGSYSISCT